MSLDTTNDARTSNPKSVPNVRNAWLSANWKRLAVPAVGVPIVAAMASSLAKHGGPMLRAASGLELRSLALALILCIAYRAVNASGWGLILGALGRPVSAVQAARLWLASEACRWLPGSLWSFGSRAVLATRRGLPGPTVAASLILELAVTVLAWTTIAGLGGASFRFPSSPAHPLPRITVPMILAALAAAGFAAALVWRSAWVRRRLRGPFAALKDLARTRPDWAKLFAAYAFYVAMAVFNGAALVLIIRALPGGASCPVSGVLAANALSWLVGFFALFAPGGLVVREACLTALLATWIPADQALAVALVWRLIQVIAEIIGFAAVAACGLPASLERLPKGRRGTQSRRVMATGLPHECSSLH